MPGSGHGGAPRAVTVDVRALVSRIRSAVTGGSYLAPADQVPPSMRRAIEAISEELARPDADADTIRVRIHQLEAAGRIDRPMKLSALSVLAASPLVRDYVEAARLASQQEFAALDEGGPWRDTYLASSARHRGVITFLLGHHGTALDWFTRALELERTPENVGNVLAALLALGEVEDAVELTSSMRASLPAEVWAALSERIERDADLVRLAEWLDTP
ncbi:MAG: hypothetical protein H6735_21490 [Alphaproteobacteria bacterium]|nr:hypothetical protein [Alphaproteobacteria bacterium]